MEKTAVILIGGNYEINDKLCPQLALSWENNFTLLGFQIDSRLKLLNENYEKCFKKVHEIGRKWARYRLSLKGRITIAKTFLLPQFTYVASVMDPSPNTYEVINKMLRSFVNTGSTIPLGKGNWINQDILYAPKSEGGFNFIDARSFFLSLKISWIKRYATDRLDDHWADIIDRELKISRGRRRQILTWGTEALTCMISKNFPCIETFFKAWTDFKTSFHFRPAKTHNNLLHSPIFFNPWILRNPTTKDLANYGDKKTEKEYLKPEQFGLSNDDCRHKKVIDLLDENGIKSIQELKDDPNLAKLNWFSLFRLETSIREFSSRNDLSLRSTGVTLPSVRTGKTPVDHASQSSEGVTTPSLTTGKTPLDYVSCISEAFQRITKGSSYYRRILLLHKPKGTTTYKAKMEKRLGTTLKQSYVTRITTMLNSGMIPTGNSDILHRFLLGKTRPGDEIRNWKNQSWDGYCKQCCKVIETTAHIFECEKTRAYLDALSINTGIHRIYNLKSLLGDYYCWSDHKKRSQIQAQFAAASFVIAEIMKGRLTGDRLSWRRTKFKLVAYVSNLLGSNNVRFNVLGEGMKEMLNIAGTILTS